ncbi:MAG: hypothetical protein WC886_07300 [Saccharofermentanaceae bacterium]|jgi:hypothetical protein
MKNLAIEIVKMEGVEKSWNMKFYTAKDETVSIYINGEKIDVSEKIEALHEAGFNGQRVEEEYTRIRKEAYKAGLDAMMAKQDRNQAIENYINSL